MKRPDYPTVSPWQRINAILRSEWQEFARTFFITLAVIIATLVAAEPHLSSIDPRIWWALAFCAISYAVSSFVSIYKSAWTKRYDPTLALKYMDVFFVDIEKDRKLATEALLVFHSTSSEWRTYSNRFEIDPVLDLLDDLGFLLQGEQISSWVL